MENTNELQELIDDINWQVWGFNKYQMERRPDTDIMKNPASTAKLIKNACELITKNPKDKNIVETCLRQIEYWCYGDNNIPSTSRLKSMTEWVASILIGQCNKVINFCKTDEDKDIKWLNQKFCNKWLYFDNCEDTSYIIYINKISYSGSDIVWSGNKLNLTTTNGSDGYGVICESVEENHFPQLGYFNDEDETDPLVIANYLSKDDGENPGMNRELSADEVKKYILNQIYWGFDMAMEDGNKWPNLFEDCRL